MNPGEIIRLLSNVQQAVQQADRLFMAAKTPAKKTEVLNMALADLRALIHSS